MAVQRTRTCTHYAILPPFATKLLSHKIQCPEEHHSDTLWSRGGLLLRCVWALICPLRLGESPARYKRNIFLWLEHRSYIVATGAHDFLVRRTTTTTDAVVKSQVPLKRGLVCYVISHPAGLILALRRELADSRQPNS